MKIKTYYLYVVFIVGIILLLIFSVLFVTHGIIGAEIEKQISLKIKTLADRINSKVNVEVDCLNLQSESLSNHELLINYLRKKETDSIKTFFEYYSGTLDDKIYLISDTTKILYVHETNNDTKDISKFVNENSIKVLKKLRKGEKTHFTWSTNGKNYLFSASLMVQEKNVIGSVYIGFPIVKLFEELNDFNFKYSILQKNKVIFSKGDLEDKEIISFSKAHKPIFDAVLAVPGASDIFSTKIANENVYSLVLPINFGISTLMIIFAQKKYEFQYLNSLILYLLSIFVAFLVIIFIILFRFKKYSKNQMVKNELSTEFLQSNENPKFKNDDILLEKVAENNIIKIPNKSNGTILISKLFKTNQQEYDTIIPDIQLNNIIDLQCECIELYFGKVENIIGDKIISLFSGDEETIDYAIQCALAIQKIVKKENNFIDFQLAFGINYGSIYFTRGEKNGLFGQSLELVQAITNVSKPDEILINLDLIKAYGVSIDQSNKRIWKFKKFKNEFSIVNIVGDKNN